MSKDRFSGDPFEGLVEIPKHLHLIRHLFLPISTNFHSIWVKNTCFIRTWPAPLSYHLSKNHFSQHRRGKEKKGYVTLWLVVWWVEWDKIFCSIYHLKKLDRFTKSVCLWSTLCDSKRHHQNIFGSRLDLRTFSDSVFDADSEKSLSGVHKRKEDKNFTHFCKRCIFWQNRHRLSISWFLTGRKNLLRLKSRYSWSAASTL